MMWWKIRLCSTWESIWRQRCLYATATDMLTIIILCCVVAHALQRVCRNVLTGDELPWRLPCCLYPISPHFTRTIVHHLQHHRFHSFTLPFQANNSPVPHSAWWESRVKRSLAVSQFWIHSFTDSSQDKLLMPKQANDIADSDCFFSCSTAFVWVYSKL